MYRKIQINSLEDYLIPGNKRPEKSVYYGRLTTYNETIKKGIEAFITETMRYGVCIEERIGNPEEKHLAYYTEIMGNSYQLDRGFFLQQINKWMPRIATDKKEILAQSFFEIMQGLAQKGKNENMQKNAYIKFMCWLYYKFERIFTNVPGSATVPKLLFQGYPNQYEMLFLSALSSAGCDILLLLTRGEEEYKQVDPTLTFSQRIPAEGGAYPEGFSILSLREQLIKKEREPKVVQVSTEKRVNTNTWISTEPMEDVLKPQDARGSDNSFSYNAFVGIYGAEDGVNYYQNLLTWKMKLETDARVCLIEEEIPKATFEEIGRIPRKSYALVPQVINELSTQITCVNRDMVPYAKAAFVQTLEQETEQPLPKFTNLAVELVCMMNRYLNLLYENTGSSQKIKKVILFYGEIKTQTERIFLEMMAKMPIDVILINPEGSKGINIKNSLFFAKNYENTLSREKFPTDIKDVRFQTVAFNAERELDSMLYQDTGIYRDRQFTKAIPVTLANTYDEIQILWDEDAKFRPNFQIYEDKVAVPVLFAKVSGVPNADPGRYWDSVAKLYQDDVYIIRDLPFLNHGYNTWKQKSGQLMVNQRIQYQRIKEHPENPFRLIRESVQDYMLEKLQELVDSKVIEDNGKNEINRLILETVLGMDKNLIRMMQQYDFTKRIPKVLAFQTKESAPCIEDAILMAYLNLLGFDIVIYVPTGYNSVETYYTKHVMEEYQVGDYLYDLKIPNLKNRKKSNEGIMGKLFRRR